MLALVPIALADKGGVPGSGAGKGLPTTPSSTLSLIANSSGNNPNSPAWCLNEDDYQQPVYSGSLSGSYTANQQLCNPSVDYYNGIWWGAGGIGLKSDVYVVGQLSDLTITAPDGTAHHAVLMGQSISKGMTTSHYAVCYCPPYSIAFDTGGTPLLGGTWQITLSGQISSARWAINLQMTDAPFQQAYCPSAEQNLSP
jgi:hypothetical protein